ncbi:MAG: diaminopimelate decarboxylase [Acidobacteriaceae bacterium]
MSARIRKTAGNSAAARDAAAARPFHYCGRALCCDGVSLEELATEYGTPLYVYSAEQIRYRFGLFQAAFAGCGATVCYAVKANSSLAILRMLAELGAGFDIVSGGELERVRRASGQKSKAALGRVVFSGAGKQEWEIDSALKAGILLFNVESEAELELLAARAEALGVRARFALRVNPDVFAETHPYISTGLGSHKFGVEIGKARAIYRRAARSKWLDAAGVSVHIGSQIRAVAPFRAALARVAGLVEELRSDGHKIRYVDAGGGLGIDYNDSPTEPKFDAAGKVREYAAALGKAAAGLGAVHLLVEPGRFVAAQAGGLLTRVLFVKKNGAKTFVIVDAAMNDLIRPALYQAHHEILPVAKGRGASVKVDVVGPVCESGDFFAHDRTMPRVKAGELLLVLDAGAYGMSESSNYNTRARASEVLVDGNEARLIRRRETLRDLMAAEIL